MENKYIYTFIPCEWKKRTDNPLGIIDDISANVFHMQITTTGQDNNYNKSNA